MGSYAIIGAHLPIACGSAWRAQYKGHDDVSVCFFGDGASNIGAFHESLNFASVWKLPVVFVCENNLYVEYTAVATFLPDGMKHPAADRASAYGMGSNCRRRRSDAVYARRRQRSTRRAGAGDRP